MRISEVLYGAGTVSLFPGSADGYVIPDYRGMNETQLQQARAKMQEQLGQFTAHRVGQTLVTLLCTLGAAGTIGLAVGGFPEWAVGLPYLSSLWFWIGCSVYRGRRDRNDER